MNLLDTTVVLRAQAERSDTLPIPRYPDMLALGMRAQWQRQWRELSCSRVVMLSCRRAVMTTPPPPPPAIRQ